jgi:hypothetical protein
MICNYEFFFSCFKHRNSSDGPLYTFYSVIKYDIILGGNSTDTDRVFILQKKIIKIMAGVGSRNLRRNLFKELDTLLLPRQYILSLMKFVVEHLEIFQINTWINGLDIRNATHLSQAGYQIIMLSASCFLCWYKDLQYSAFQNLESQK